MMEDSNDPAKWKSRKLWMSILSVALITCGFAARIEFSVLETVYAQFIAGILGVLTLYLGGSVGNKFVVSKKVKGDVNGSNE